MMDITRRIAVLEKALQEARELLLQAADVLAEAETRPMLEEDLKEAVQRYRDILFSTGANTAQYAR